MWNSIVICVLVFHLISVAQAATLKSAILPRLNRDPRHDLHTRSFTVRLDHFSPQDQTTVNFVSFFFNCVPSKMY